jgi:hypothetical protein
VQECSASLPVPLLRTPPPLWVQVSQLDLVQMHWWDYAVPGMVDAGLALADLQAKGLIKQVGGMGRGEGGGGRAG